MAKKVDFQKLIIDLESKGMTAYKIALAMHQKWEKIDRWRNGKSEPAHYEGEMLIEIHRDMFHVEQLPRRE